MLSAMTIDDLVADLRPVPHRSGIAPILPGLIAGGAATLLAVSATLGIQPGLMSVGRGAPFLMKLGYTGSIAALALAAVAGLAVPAGRNVRWNLLTVPALLLAGLAAYQLLGGIAHPPAVQMLGQSWDKCPLRIMAFSIPLFAGLTFMVRRQAPVRLGRAGASIGLAAGASGAAIYALACTESTAAFVAIWYSLGIAAVTAFGALAGPRLLRW